MLKDITLGQYFPGNSPVHRVDPRVKLLLTIAYIVALFLIQNEIGFLVIILFAFLVIRIAKLPVLVILKGIKPIIPLVIFTGILNMFFVSGEPSWSFWIFTVSLQGIRMAITMSIRIVCLIIGTSLLTYTTSPIALTDGLERLLSPLRFVRFPVHEMSMMMTIALRFIPTLTEETDKIMSAQKARGADLETGSVIKRAKALIPILIPLFISAFRRADDLALAMECRCYRGGDKRTRMKQLHLGWVDAVASIVMCGILAAVILINLFLPTLF